MRGARIVYKDLAVGAAEDASVAAVRVDPVSDPDLLPFGSGDTTPYISLEPNFWVLDGTMQIYDSQPVSLWSENRSDSGGLISTGDAPALDITFDDQYASTGVSFVFLGDSYPTSIRIQWLRSGSVLEDETFTPDAMIYFCEFTVTGFDEVIINFSDDTLPGRRIRLDSVSFGRVREFLLPELRDVEIVQEIDPSSRELAANELEWTLSSEEEVDYLFQFKQPVEAYMGDELLGVFYIMDSERTGAKLYHITCSDAVGVLGDDPWPDAVYTNKNALALAQEICAGFTVDMAVPLQAKTVSGVLVGQTRRTALQQLCFAIGAVADTSNTSKIKIFELPTSDPKEIPRSRIRTGSSVSIGDLVTAVQLTAHSYSTTGSGTSVDIGGVTYYDTQTVVEIDNPAATAADKPFVISITDATLIGPGNVQEIAQRLYDAVMERDTHDLSFRLEGERVGDYVTTVTPWGTQITGHYIKGSIQLSSFALSAAEVTA